MKYILILLFVVFIIGVYFYSTKKKEGKLSFNKKKYFFTEAERKFYLMLKQVADKNNWVIFPKVRLRDLFYAYGENRLINNNKVNQKHIDFLLCENSGFCPVLGIELDDSSHFLEKRKQRDDFVNKVFASTGLPLLRIKVAFNYNLNSLEQEILSKTKK